MGFTVTHLSIQQTVPSYSQVWTLNPLISLYQLWSGNMVYSSDEHYEMSTQEQIHFLPSGILLEEFNMGYLQRCLIDFTQVPHSTPCKERTIQSVLMYFNMVHTVVQGHGKPFEVSLNFLFDYASIYFLTIIHSTTTIFMVFSWIDISAVKSHGASSLFWGF